MTEISFTDSGLVLASDPLPGRELHDVLRSLRSQFGDVAPATFHGLPAFVVLGWDTLRDFFAAQDQFPGGEVYKYQLERTVGRTFISMDGPEHDLYRRLVTPAFRSRAAVRFVDEELTPLAHELLDTIQPMGSADLVAEFTSRLPFWAISRKLGLPEGFEDRQRGWALAILSEPSDPEAARVAADELSEVIAPVVAERRSHPGTDVISQLVTQEFQGTRLTDAEVHSHVRLLFAVGATTTSDALSNLLWALLCHPEILLQAVVDPEIRPAVVRELLRWEPPVPLLPRMAVRDGIIGTTPIPAGSVILAGIASANRDPNRFDDPDRFDIGRPDADILTFGFGVKFCPGTHMAKQQLLAALDVVLERLPGLRFASADFGAVPSGCNLRSVSSLQCEWDA
ncbi:MAG: cytochrome P450 [Acidimicrobiales bacterium]